MDDRPADRREARTTSPGHPDFPDTLVALGMLDRDDEPDPRYRNTTETAAYLDRSSPTYLGGVLEMCNARLYGFWGDLTEALRTGAPQNEIKHTGQPMFAELYSDPKRLQQFMNAMTGASMTGFHALAETFDFTNYRTVCDLGGATGQLSVILAARHPHLRCTTFDLPAVEPLAQQTINTAGLGDRVSTASGDFFLDPHSRGRRHHHGNDPARPQSRPEEGNSSKPPTTRSPPAARSSASKRSSTTPAAPTPSHS